MSNLAWPTALITAETLQVMPDLELCELVAGQIVPYPPATNEQSAITSTVVSALSQFGNGRVRVGGVGICTHHNPDTVRAADVIYISNERYAQQGNRRGYLQVAPELVVEVLSPSDSWGGVMAKLGDYFAGGVLMVWVIDPDARQVFVYRSLTNVRQFSEADTLPGDEILPDLALPVANLFVDG
jgi:Uma2 family endonuclease